MGRSKASAKVKMEGEHLCLKRSVLFITTVSHILTFQAL